MKRELLIRIEPDLPPGKSAVRRLYATQGCVKWMNALSVEPVAGKLALLPPYQEVAAFAAEFVSGCKLSDVKRVSPTKHGIYKVNLLQVRIVGWVPEHGAMIWVVGADIDAAHDRSSPQHMDELLKVAIAFRKRSGLGPGCTGVPTDVL